MTVLIPARWAASTFSLTPPTGRTWPLKVISPVMARSLWMRLSVSREANAVSIVTPAEGPSLGMAPAGTWMWISWFSKKSSSIPIEAALALAKLSAAVADSFMTSPSWPVRVRPFLPFIAVASMKRSSPPVGVQARPVATPGVDIRVLVSAVKRTGPRYS